jgi:hypothetical protein
VVRFALEQIGYGVLAAPLRDRVLDFAEEEGELLNLAVFFGVVADLAEM